MKSLLRRHPLLAPVTMLVLASVAGLFLFAARAAISRHLQHLYLPWNLFLAWMPLLLALGVNLIERRAPTRAGRWAALGLTAAWLLFLPNAPYLLTDLVHLPEKHNRHYYPDMMLILHFALIGLMSGFLSLHVMHGLIERRYGRFKGWSFIAAVTALSGFGIYVGRFLRWNSWDVVVRPFDLLAEFLAWAHRLADRPSELILPALFASTTSLAYLLFASLFRQTTGTEAAGGVGNVPAKPCGPVTLKAGQEQPAGHNSVANCGAAGTAFAHASSSIGGLAGVCRARLLR